MLGFSARSMRNGPTVSITRASVASEVRRCSTAVLGSKPSTSSPSAIELRAFDREEAAFGHNSALGRKTADLAAGGEHAMARDNDRERVSPERLPHGARGAGCAEPSRDGAIRQGLARRNGACDVYRRGGGTP